MTEQRNKTEELASCGSQCPVHGDLSVRGRNFQGTVVKKMNKRVTIAFDRTVYVRKYERYAKARTKLHARLPKCMESSINVGDYIKISECRPLSKIIHFGSCRRPYAVARAQAIGAHVRRSALMVSRGDWY